ncbi:AraC-like DNA-binding protein [Paenibacillus phyllosphaerae]|uniref:AraC-like DNA-binding protein n=1 Tax=Paenibacillus phyllosphaerae TaxID=274593 RepID=A0A7W5FRY5_9BACL|nr:AraC family transcriptional regulator [Paenibacillus phyllosphaerae]MBB3114479.1 AraC-like DNA-binding protein [Paenibacillus phyllosphaerae]
MMEYIYTEPVGLTDLAVLEVGTQACSPDMAVGPCVRDMYILHYVHRGFGTYTTGGHTAHIGPGRLFLILPDAVHTYSPDPSEPWEYSWIGFTGTYAYRLFEQAGFSGSVLVRQPDAADPIDALFRELLGYRDTHAKELLLTGALYRLFGLLAIPPSAPPASPDAGPHVRKAVAFMNARYADRIGLPDIADHLGLDAKYVCRIFQQRLSMSPYRYLTDVRMRKACRLLRMQMLSIAEVARSVGYPDPLLFSRMFKRTIGLSPTAYREKARLESAGDKLPINGT